MKAIRYFLDRDESGHWYKVEETRRAEWRAWVALDINDEKSWHCPTFATPLKGGPHNVSFESPIEA